jgi:hypothetical protein
MAGQNEMMQMIRQQQYQRMREQLLARNMAYADRNWQKAMTELSPEQEKAFMDWVQSNKVPFNPKDQYPDYDMRGFYQALQSGDPRAVSAVNPNDQRLHYPDYWKTPYHESFSSESQWAKEGAPSWQEDKLTMPTGEVVFDPTAKEKE